MSELKTISEQTQTETQLAIAWQNLSFHGSSLFRKSKPILSDVSGVINFGSLNALMGPSGAGKSTLLKCINGRNNSGLSSETKIYLNKKQPLIPCFIVQDVKEHLLMGVTGREALLYASKLKNTGQKADHKRFVTKMMADLMIRDIANTVVGNCSGGEQKRLAIAAELMGITKPNLVCIDEPTSGLDSNAAEIVVQCLKDISRRHSIAIVTSIHQPNADVLLMFDQLYVLAKGGKCAYFGPPQNLSQQLIDNNIEYEEYQLPIEVLLKVASKGINDDKVIDLCNSNRVLNNDQIIEICKSQATLSPNGIQSKSKPFRIRQLIYLMQRMLVNTYRSQVVVMLIQFVIIVGIGVILAKLYNSNIGKPDGCFSLAVDANASCVKSAHELYEEKLLRQNLKFHFFDVVLLNFLQVAVTTLTFGDEIRIFFNEHSNKWYSTGSYYWAKTIVELPITLAIGILYVAIGYEVSGQIRDLYRYIGYMSMCIAGILCSQGIGFLFGIISPKNQQLSLVLSVAVFIMMMFLSGFFIPIAEMAKPVQHITNVSYIRQLFQNALIFIYGLDRCPTYQRSVVLFQFDLHEDDQNKMTINVIILVAHLLIVRFVALIVLMIKANPSPKMLKKKSKD